MSLINLLDFAAERATAEAVADSNKNLVSVLCLPIVEVVNCIYFLF